MKVFLAGATGAIGRPLTAQLVAANHDVVAMTRSPLRAAEIQKRGATVVVCDVWDREELFRCMREAQPDVVIHQLTALPKRIDPRKIRTQLAETNRLRREGTRNLFDAALSAGAKRFIAQSIAFAYAPNGSRPLLEDACLYANAPKAFADVIHAVGSLEETTLSRTELPGIVLRYGFLYGPGTAYASDGSFADDVRRRRVPIVGNGSGEFSFTHVEDAAAATVAAVTVGRPGIYNVVDDDPAPVSEWLPVYAKTLGARRPGRVPQWLARLLVGHYAIYLMCEQRGASNAKAKRVLGWSPRYVSWLDGFQSIAAGRPKVERRVKEVTAQ